MYTLSGCQLHVYLSHYSCCLVAVWSWFIECRLVDSQFVDDFKNIFSFQLLIVSYSLAMGGSGGAELLGFSIYLKGFGFSEPGIQCFSVYCVDESRVDQMAFDELALNLSSTLLLTC